MTVDPLGPLDLRYSVVVLVMFFVRVESEMPCNLVGLLAKVGLPERGEMVRVAVATLGMIEKECDGVTVDEGTGAIVHDWDYVSGRSVNNIVSETSLRSWRRRW